MKILGIDFESAGTRKQGHYRAVEVGYGVYNTASNRLEMCQGYFLNDLAVQPTSEDVFPAYLEIPEEVSKIHHIKTEEVIKYGKPTTEFISDMALTLLYDVDAIMVWNGLFFDIPLLHDIIKRTFQNLDNYAIKRLLSLPVIDLKVDGLFKEKLNHTAADYGILAFFPHMGIADVITMFQVLHASKLDVNHLLEKAKSPMVISFAVCDFDTKDLAKEQGYKYCKIYDNSWWKLHRESEYIADKEQYKFATWYQLATAEMLDLLMTF